MSHQFFVWLEATGFSVWMRESPSLWAFPAILTLHTIGLGLLAGINAALDFRILGIAPQIEFDAFRRYLPFMWIGLGVNVATGIALLIAYPTKALTNPVFYAKLLLIAVALVILRIVRRRVLGRHADGNVLPNGLKALASISLACWAVAIVAGRLLAYTYVHLRADW